MLILPESWDESKTNFNGEVDRFKIGAGEGRKNDARKNWAMHFGSSSPLVSKVANWYTGC